MGNWLDWIGLALVVIGWILMLIAVIYIGTVDSIDGTFWALSIVGLALMLAGLLLVIWGHWAVIFGKSKTSSDDVVSQAINAPDDLARSLMNAPPSSYSASSASRTPPSGFMYVQPK